MSLGHVRTRGILPGSNGFTWVPIFHSLVSLFRADSSMLSAYSMARGQEETSTSQAGRRQGPSRESPSTSNIISSLSIDEVRSYC